MQQIYDKVMSVFSFFLGWERFFPTWKNLNFPNLLITNLLINLRPLLPASSEALLACLEALPTGFKALPAGSQALPTGSEVEQRQEKRRKSPYVVMP